MRTAIKHKRGHSFLPRLVQSTVMASRASPAAWGARRDPAGQPPCIAGPPAATLTRGQWSHASAPHVQISGMWEGTSLARKHPQTREGWENTDSLSILQQNHVEQNGIRGAAVSQWTLTRAQLHPGGRSPRKAENLPGHRLTPLNVRGQRRGNGRDYSAAPCEPGRPLWAGGCMGTHVPGKHATP